MVGEFEILDRMIAADGDDSYDDTRSLPVCPLPVCPSSRVSVHLSVALINCYSSYSPTTFPSGLLCSFTFTRLASLACLLFACLPGWLVGWLLRYMLRYLLTVIIREINNGASVAISTEEAPPSSSTTATRR